MGPEEPWTEALPTIPNVLIWSSRGMVNFSACGAVEG